MYWMWSRGPRSRRPRAARRCPGRASGARCTRSAACRRSRSGGRCRGRRSARPGGAPASTMANVRPAWPMTLVLALSKSMPWTLRPASGSPSAAAHRRRAHPPVAVPLGLAVAQPDAVHHPVADEPVVASPGPRRRPGSARCAGSGPSSSAGSVPMTGRSKAVTSSCDRGVVALEVAVAGLGDRHGSSRRRWGFVTALLNEL